MKPTATPTPAPEKAQQQDKALGDDSDKDWPRPATMDPSLVSSSIGLNLVRVIRDSLQARGESLSELARRWTVSRQYVSRILGEGSETNFTIETLRELAELLNLSLVVELNPKQAASSASDTVQQNHDTLAKLAADIFGTLEAHEVETLDCDRRGERYCDCLDRLKKRYAALKAAQPAPDAVREVSDAEIRAAYAAVIAKRPMLESAPVEVGFHFGYRAALRSLAPVPEK